MVGLALVGFMVLLGSLAALAPPTKVWSFALGVALAALGVFCLAGTRLALRAARARPRLLVDQDALTIDHPGLLRLPLVVSRGEVREVWIGSGPAPRRNPESPEASRWRRIRAYCRPVHDGTGYPPLGSSRVLPDFCEPLGPAVDLPNVLVVLRDRYDLDGLPRRGLRAFTFLGDESGGYDGPVRGAQAHGFLFQIGRAHV